MKFLLIFYAAIINCVNSSSVNNYVRLVCGGPNKCTVEENATLPRDSCCRPCECDPICMEKKTCCEDSSFSLNASKGVSMQTCLPSVRFSKSRNDERHFYKYYTRATCPDKYADNQIRYKCESNEPEDLDDIPFVSSSDGKIVYKNRHCAFCHGEEEFITWDLEIDMGCIKEIFWDTDGNFVSANVSHIKNTLKKICSISLKRPAITDIRHTICYDEQTLVSTCEHNSSPPDNTMEEIKELCLNDDAALTFFNNFKPGKGYSNVYCYLCNNKEAAATCDLEVIERNTQSFMFLLNDGPLIEMEMETEESNQRKELCGYAEVFDTFFGICRRMFCPFFEFPRQGVCTPLVLSRRLNYAFKFEVYQMSQSLLKPGEFLDLLQIFHKTLMRQLGLGSCSVCGFRYNEGRLNSTNAFYLQAVVTTTDECKYDLVLSVAASLEMKVRSMQKLTYVIQHVEMLIRYIWSDEEYNNLTAHSNTILSRNTMSCRHFSPARFQNCPKVALTVDEYNCFANTSKIEEYETAQNQHGEFEICYADYTELVNNMTGSVGEKRPFHPLAVLSFVLLLLLWF